MLRYLGYGERRYAERGIGLYPRPYWEVEICLRGAIRPLLDHDDKVNYNSSLWIFSPVTPHGWTAAVDSTADVAVFHLDALPAQVRSAVEPEGWLRIDLSSQDCSRFEDLAQRALAEQQAPTGASVVLDELVQSEVLWLILRQQPEPLDAQGQAQRVVDRALAWFEEHLREGPGLTALAAAVPCSVAHMRRLCHQAYGCSPQVLIDQLRLRHMQFFLREQVLSQEAIAHRCGLSSASALSRTFRRLMGRNPRQWLQELPADFPARAE